MRILLATDAWEPQVNGVVRTLTRMVAECRAMGHEVEVIQPGQFKTFPLPDLSGDQAGDRRLRGDAGALQGLRAGGDPHRHRGAHRPRRAAHLRGMEAAVHHQLPHPIPGVRLGPAADAAGGRLRLHEVVPQAVGAADGGHAHHARRADRARLPQHLALVARRRHRAVPGPTASRSATSSAERTGPGRSSSTWAGWRWRRTSRPSWRSTCPAPRSSSATARPAAELEAKYPEAIFLGARFGEELAALLRLRRRLRLPLADRHLRPGDPGGHGRRARRWRPIRRPGPSTSSPARAPAAIDEDLKAACLEALKLDRETVRAFAEKFSWRACAEEFVENLQPYPEPEKTRFWRRLRRLARVRGKAA